MATDGVGELQASVGGLLLARDDGDALPTQFKVCLISPLSSSFKKSWAGHFSPLQYPGHNHISLTIVLYFDQCGAAIHSKGHHVSRCGRGWFWRPCQKKLAADINSTQRSYHKIIAKCMVICSALSASRDAHQPVLLRLCLFIVSSWWWVFVFVSN